jgi:hypothetical protein
MPDSYLEKCIGALPQEKQPAAREAFKAIAENGDDNLISKLLVILEATSAYAETIPQTLSASGERFLGDLDARLAKAAQIQTEHESAREGRLRQLLTEQVPQLGKAMALDKIAAEFQGQAAELGRIERSLTCLRQARVGGLFLLMLLGVLLGAGAVVGLGWRGYQGARQAEQFVTRLNVAGIAAKIRRTEAGEVLTIEGAEVLRGTVWRKDDKGYIVGVDIVYPAQ